VKHLVLGVRSLGPRRGFVPRLGLEVEAHPASRIANLNPPLTVACRDLPPEQTAVEGRQPLGVAAVDADTRPTHSTAVSQLRVELFMHFEAFPVLEAAAGGSKIEVGTGSNRTAFSQSVSQSVAPTLTEGVETCGASAEPHSFDSVSFHRPHRGRNQLVLYFFHERYWARDRWGVAPASG